MKLIFRLRIALLILSFNIPKCYSQGLSIGDTVPDLEFDQILNYSKEKMKISDFKGKLIIFDFWGFWCSSCLKNFPKTDSLQKKYNNKIQIILVNRNDKEKTSLFFKNRKNFRMPEHIPQITSDTVLRSLFPHIGVPYYAWVSESGKIIYSTHEPITSEIIDRHFKGETNLYNKIAETKYQNSFIEPSYYPHVKYGTLFIRGIDSINIHIENARHEITYDCRSIVDLYQIAYNESDINGRFGFREPGRTILEVKNPEKYEYRPESNFDKWRKEHGYYYESILPARLENERYKIMQEDLNRYFGLNVSIENRLVKCLAIERTSKIDKLKSKGGKPYKTPFSFSPYSPDSLNYKYSTYRIRNKPFNELYETIKNISDLNGGIMIFNETGYNGNIDFEMPKSKSHTITIENFKDALKKYDIAIIEKEIMMNVLIIRE